MGLMAAQAIDFGSDLCDVRRIRKIRDRVRIHRVSAAKLHGQYHNLVFREVILRKLDLAVEDGEYVIGFERFRLRIRTMALEAQRIRSLGAQQVLVLAAVWLMAGGASLLEYRLMQRVLLGLLHLVAVARQADI